MTATGLPGSPTNGVVPICPKVMNRRLDVIFLAQRNTAGGDNRIRLIRRLRQCRTDIVKPVRQNAQVNQLTSQIRQQGSKSITVGVKDTACRRISHPGGVIDLITRGHPPEE